MAQPAAPIKLVTGSDGFGTSLKNELIAYAQEKGILIEDLGEDKYFVIAENVAKRVLEAASNKSSITRGLLVCGTGMGVSIFANKFPGISAAVCENVEAAQNSRSINNSNVLALGGVVTSVEAAKNILDTWLSTEFKAPCPASGLKPWSQDVSSFLDDSLTVISITEAKDESKDVGCPVCSLSKDRSFQEVVIMPGGSWTILRETPTSAVVRFKAGSVEPAHHHSHGHDVVILTGEKKVHNLTAGTVHNLGPGDFLYTPAGHIHRVVYLTDTEFFIKWEGKWDILLDEDVATAKVEIEKLTMTP